MLQKMIGLSLGFALVVALAQRAPAETASCGQRADLVSQLQTRYLETRRAIALAENNAVLEIFASESGSWTILVTRANGQSCLIASGEAFEALAETLPAQDTAL
ncbi:hypothetical protein BMG00_11695 [Thioclava marina]|jgi:hypothetical protein|uniref:Uncharacterized protein n=2 Tax=Thioclava marina TaxID=1915077 RepID=A0ABX3MJQ0_9RHOB|nr:MULTISPECIES: hypothetical protein [Thioclava]OOY11744.1 hypothetical protein BMG00_11695 [Thioclava marina]OOY27550.1 hypothetical protein BMI90_13220 [Thioclava sp. L04-15]